jgi:hypothetical protein
MTTVNEDIDMLSATAVELATEQIEKDGEFFPFALAIAIDHDDDDDEIDVIEAGAEEEGAEIGAEDAMDSLVAHFSENRDTFRAVAIVFDAEMDEEWDAITVLVAHSSGKSVDVQAPYRTSGRKRIWGEIEQSDGSLEIWD